jgi:type II secretion system protein N
MSKWVAYASWGLLCFFVFFYLLFPYEALSRRILHTLEQKTTLIARASKPGRRHFGIRWARVDLISPRYKNLPPIQIEDWVIRFQPLSLLFGRVAVSSRGTIMGGSFETGLVKERGGYHGVGEWQGVQLDQFPLLVSGEAVFTGICSGRVLWKSIDQGLSGEGLFELRDGKMENVTVAGFSLPLLEVGTMTGEMTLEGKEIHLEEILLTGRDIQGKLTGNVVLENPFVKSRMMCRLEIGLTEPFLNNYPAMKALFRNDQGRSKPLVLALTGTIEAPRVSPAQ